ncbi:hypothetical protein A0H81_14509 [Grifola frondosa]|uniref:Uncharacterized protein n=1 Tax=Grifola frondosa TaxID=5627 RepID=A0A1C7LNS0_GRIFR|nr:hypothetical protein A0H81_14509 [Grifola frondosa]
MELCMHRIRIHCAMPFITVDDSNTVLCYIDSGAPIWPSLAYLQSMNCPCSYLPGCAPILYPSFSYVREGWKLRHLSIASSSNTTFLRFLDTARQAESRFSDVQVRLKLYLGSLIVQGIPMNPERYDLSKCDPGLLCQTTDGAARAKSFKDVIQRDNQAAVLPDEGGGFVSIKLIKGVNHFMQWDEPQTTIQMYLEAVA